MTRLLRCVLPCAAVLLALAPLPAAAQAFVGTWAANAAQCRNGQEVEDAPMIVQATRYDQHEAHCAFQSIAKRGAGWSVNASCVVEGNRVAANFTLRVAGNTLTLTDKYGVQDLKRCP